MSSLRLTRLVKLYANNYIGWKTGPRKEPVLYVRMLVSRYSKRSKSFEKFVQKNSNVVCPRYFYLDLHNVDIGIEFSQQTNPSDAAEGLFGILLSLSVHTHATLFQGSSRTRFRFPVNEINGV